MFRRYFQDGLPFKIERNTVSKEQVKNISGIWQAVATGSGTQLNYLQLFDENNRLPEENKRLVAENKRLVEDMKIVWPDQRLGTAIGYQREGPITYYLYTSMNYFSASITSIAIFRRISRVLKKTTSIEINITLK